jgi:phage tail protein X
MRVSALQGDTLDLICWRELGTTVDVVEQAYDLNPSLADAGPILAEGTIVTLPDVLPASTLTRETINLWD